MSIDLVDDPDSLASLAEPWRRLAERRSNAFLTPEWFFAWLRHYGEDAVPAVAVERDAAGEPVGFLPLVASGRGPLRSLRFAGGALGDLFHPLAADGEAELAAAAVAALRGRGERSALVLDKVEAEAGWLAALAGRGETLTVLAHRDQVLPEIDIAGLSWEDYLAARSRNMRSQLGRRRRKLERDHELVFRLSDRERLGADLETFFRLHHGRWAGRGGSSALGERSLGFHGEFAAAALERGWLRLWMMELRGEPAAAWYGWRIGDRYAYYLAGFDERFASLSIGTVLLAHTIRSAIEEGARIYDLLLGSEDYKARFATGERRVRSVIVSPPLNAVRVAAVAESAVRRSVERLAPETRERVKGRLRGLADRLPFR